MVRQEQASIQIYGVATFRRPEEENRYLVQMNIHASGALNLL
jgi:hypothetical protein